MRKQEKQWVGDYPCKTLGAKLIHITFVKWSIGSYVLFNRMKYIENTTLEEEHKHKNVISITFSKHIKIINLQLEEVH